MHGIARQKLVRTSAIGAIPSNKIYY